MVIIARKSHCKKIKICPLEIKKYISSLKILATNLIKTIKPVNPQVRKNKIQINKAKKSYLTQRPISQTNTNNLTL